MNLGLKPLSFTSLSALWKSGDGVSDHFPAGLRVLVVDDDPTCLAILDKMLKNCLYQVTTCNRAELALRLLRDNKNGFDIVLSDVHMPDMDGFKLLEHVGLEMDLPVIMMSADDSKNIVMKGVTHGACDYLIKPVRMEALKNIWQHVVRKKRVMWMEKDFEQADDGEQQQQKSPDDGNCSEGNWQSSKKRKDEEEDEAEERDDPSSSKKPRVVWSVELHQQFVNAVNQLGIDKAVPKKILELMNVPGLTRENVASHLQKYRLYLRRLSGVSQHQNSILGPSDASFGPISSLDLQALAASGQLPPSAVTIPLSDQRGVFNFESRFRYVEGREEQNTNRKQENLLHGVPTNLDSKQIASLSSHANSQSSLSSILPSQMVQMQSRTQIFNESSGGQVLNLPLPVAQPILTMPCLEYPPLSQRSSIVDFSKSWNTEFPLINFSHGSNSASSSFTPMFQDEVSSEMKGSRGLLPNYSDVNWTGFGDRCLNIGGSIFDASQQLQRGLNVLPSVSVQQQFCPNQTGELNKQVNVAAANNLLLAKAQRLPGKSFKNTLFSETVHQDHLMTALLKQQENGLEPVGTELGFNG